MTVRTRFAPSPTGYLHIGGVRTALFNYLFARKHGGQFILRIDDTDQQRNVAEALQPILDGFKWLGLNWDEGAEVGGPHGPYYQSQKLARYQDAVKQLLDKGLAYWDYATADETKAEMDAAEKEKRPKIYSRRWMATTDADRARFEAEGRKGAVKAKMPREGVCRFHDHIRGDVEVAWATEQDTVIQRSDGSVTYNLANVVDDFDMRITHVIRAEEHLSNTPRQIFMLEGLGYPRPEYAHVPFVAEPGSKNKLSKRKIAQYLKKSEFKKVYDHAKAIADKIGLKTEPESFNPVLVEFYEKVGYLPDAIVNYLVLLGWSFDGSTEFFTREEMVREFSLERVNSASASLDVTKLQTFQDWHNRKLGWVLPYLQQAKLVPSPTPTPIVELILNVIKQAEAHRLKVAGDILKFDYFFVPDEELSYNPSAFDKNVRQSPKPDWLRQLRGVLANDGKFDRHTILDQVKNFTESKDDIKLSDVNQTLRVAVTGVEDGFGTYETLAILGRERCLARIDRALSQL